MLRGKDVLSLVIRGGADMEDGTRIRVQYARLRYVATLLLALLVVARLGPGWVLAAKSGGGKENASAKAAPARITDDTDTPLPTDTFTVTPTPSDTPTIAPTPTCDL